MKVFAPCSASWRGTPIEPGPDGSAEIPDAALDEMTAHGFRRWTEADDDAVRNGTADDPANMSRKELIAALRGKVEGRVMLMKTEDMRAVALDVLGTASKPAAAPVPQSGTETYQDGVDGSGAGEPGETVEGAGETEPKPEGE